jgi:VIT1/CCC1 family predicted Fe2+/Mn2+ transporter
MNPLASWKEEQRSVYLLRVCAHAETGNLRAELYHRLAGEAEAQAAIWRAQLTARGHPPPPRYVPEFRTRLVARLVRGLGPRRMAPVLAAMKMRGLCARAAGSSGDGEYATSSVAYGLEHRHGSAGGRGNLRSVAFGVNEGLVSNASLMLGVAGATSDPRLVLVSGVAGLAAGALARAAGEYVAVRSQHEVLKPRDGRKRNEPKPHTEAEAQELALIYAAKEMPRKDANKLAQQNRADPQHVLGAHAGDNPGLTPADPATPLSAAAIASLAFAFGAAVPLAPFAVSPSSGALYASIGAAAVALFAMGAVLSLFTGRGAWPAGARMLALGMLAGTATYGIGRAFGAAFG